MAHLSLGDVSWERMARAVKKVRDLAGMLDPDVAVELEPLARPEARRAGQVIVERDAFTREDLARVRAESGLPPSSCSRSSG